MMEIKREDRRIRQTKEKLRNALAELMKEKGFESIRIHDLTERADINRGTFYLHYKDKYDLLEQNENEIIQDIVHIHEEAKKTEHAKHPRPPSEPASIFVHLFEYLQENSDFIQVLLGKNGHYSFQTKLKTILRENMLKKFLNAQLEKRMLIPIEYFSSYVISAHLGIIQQWVEGGMKESPKEMALIITRITFHQIIAKEEYPALKFEKPFQKESESMYNERDK